MGLGRSILDNRGMNLELVHHQWVFRILVDVRQVGFRGVTASRPSKTPTIDSITGFRQSLVRWSRPWHRVHAKMRNVFRVPESARASTVGQTPGRDRGMRNGGKTPKLAPPTSTDPQRTASSRESDYTRDDRFWVVASQI